MEARTQSRVLVGRLSRCEETPPPLRLRQHFLCAWGCELDHRLDGEIIVVPDGAPDLIWRDGRLSVVGPDVVAARPTLQPGSTILGLRFAPGAAAQWLGVPIDEIVGREVPLVEFWGRSATELADRIGEAKGSAGRARLHELLEGRAAAIPPAPAEAALIFASLRRVRRVEPTLAALRDRLGMSERTLRRHSHHLFGYGPKTLDRILRFQRFQRLACDDPGEDIAELACRAGYFDQPHLSREVSGLCGLTPGTLVKQLRAA